MGATITNNGPANPIESAELPKGVKIGDEEVTINLDELEGMAKEFNKNKVSKIHRVNEKNRKAHVLESKRRKRDQQRNARSRNRK